ncbi:peptide chain release factor N(5)-glutamine methyltransferase [Glaciimonas sp. CA11.2]|uniref:peptide chain release factor N(5)-glutamine methyltransferase n=1 Tax=Glaciimonas sp. CA11.2 TaxID=3048601 RepID=UPI002AB43405|nr:peptide chain release factor N(5)-glutamine methyltransferase [Glaciimonas sp. CA11.2]MDY7546525.1 peptide chain release factor N(5)-glutamine methyltransferase [Glaciimonas sp. CA11.2]MEB0162090.1 peptide chain release factor N(5)-glutamine methyltransferase [Glaciimonas sp. CA11.2]
MTDKQQTTPSASSQTAFAIEHGFSVAGILKTAPLEPLENRLLIMHALGLTRTQLITQDQRSVDAQQAALLTQLFRRRMEGEPIAYILGEREFFGLMLEVTPDVLIPRPDTELLVELALERLTDAQPSQNITPQTVLDLGTGSGAIAIAIAATRTHVQVTAVDVSIEALAVARRNAARHLALRADKFNLVHSDWYAALNTSDALGKSTPQRFDMIVANPPYIVEGDRHLSQGDLRFEPLNALTDHADGLSALRIIANNASDHLNQGGWLLMEHGYDQAEAVIALLQTLPFEAIQSWQDLAGIARVSGGRLKSAAEIRHEPITPNPD